MVPTGCGSFNSLFFFCKGIIWLVLGGIVEVPQLVSKVALLFLPFCLCPFTSRCSPRCISTVFPSILLYIISDHRARFLFQISDQLHGVRLAILSEGRLSVSHSFCITVVRELQSDHNYHRRHADASHSSEFRVHAFERVRHSSISFLLPLSAIDVILGHMKFPK